MPGKLNFLFSPASDIKSGRLVGSGYHPSILPVLQVLSKIKDLRPCMPHPSRAYSSLTSLCSVKPRPHQVFVSIQHQAPALVDENYPIVVEIMNADDTDLEVKLDILLQPTDADGAGKEDLSAQPHDLFDLFLVNQITLDGEQSPSLIKGADCGVVKPGESVSKILHLLSGGAPGDRVLDISVQTRIPEDSSFPGKEDQDNQAHDATEKLQTITVPTLEAFKVAQEITFQHNLKEWGTITDLSGYSEDYVDDGRGTEATVVTDVSIAGPWSVYVEYIEFEDEVSIEFYSTRRSV